jgi:hypothetical protein
LLAYIKDSGVELWLGHSTFLQFGTQLVSK